MLKTGFTETPHGRISWVDTGGEGPVVLLIHGNSSCKEIFGRQLVSELGLSYRMIAFDLPGHGQSSDAPDPEKTYSIHGYADAAMALLAAFGVKRAVVVGWSLGGHAALELLERWPGTVAAWITGTPPAGAADMGDAFIPSEHMGLTFKDSFTDEEAAIYAQETVGASVDLHPWMIDACKRADGRFRPLMLQSVAAGLDVDGRMVAETALQPLAVVSGSEEPFVSNAFLRTVDYRNLWDGKVHILDGLAHMPFWEAPEIVNPLLGRFLDEVTG
ncbi:MAG: alpha/beta hydrolase [Parvibaculum sp.]|uniref:alpha/beta fold hydrolase n=1 Tax=Parvibaculum sp. TaxID=2024848 RepID=UPI00284DC7D3|nr:alpha/beta hydrolase [Parvibaculum sp.]MDR3497647.1 alpha/beta hydrolase [Parvibaculum sp.]